MDWKVSQLDFVAMLFAQVVFDCFQESPSVFFGCRLEEAAVNGAAVSPSKILIPFQSKRNQRNSLQRSTTHCNAVLLDRMPQFVLPLCSPSEETLLAHVEVKTFETFVPVEKASNCDGGKHERTLKDTNFAISCSQMCVYSPETDDWVHLTDVALRFVFD